MSLDKSIYNESARKSMVRTICDAANQHIFRIREFEKNGRIYEMAGIEFWNKYCPTGGSRKTVTTPKFMATRGSRKVRLEEFVFFTKGLELTHLLLLGPTTYLSAVQFHDGSIQTGMMLTGLNLLGNCYPIMAQRYNRNRAERILERRIANAQDVSGRSGYRNAL